MLNYRGVFFFLLAGLAGLVVLFSGSGFIFASAVVIASAVAVVYLVRLILGLEAIKFASVLAVSVLLGYGFGTLIFLVGTGTIQVEKLPIGQYWSLYFRQEDLSIAFAYCLLSSALLFLFSRLEDTPLKTNELLWVKGPKAERPVWLGLAIVGLAIFSGNLGYMGIQPGDSRRISAMSAIAMLILPALVPYSLLLFVNSSAKLKRIVLLICIAFFIGVLLVSGRRFLVYSLVLSAVVLGARGLRFSTRQIVFGAVALVVALFVLYWGFFFFMSLRLEVRAAADGVPLTSLISGAWDRLFGSQVAIVREMLAHNVVTRPFIISYLAGLINIDSVDMPLYGGELWYSVKMAVPSVFFPEKTDVLPANPEALTHPIYGIPIQDLANSVLVTGYNDFGFVGALVYPVGVAILYSQLTRAVKAVAPVAPVFVFIALILLFQLFFIEQSFTSVVVNVRNGILLTGILTLLHTVPLFGFSDGGACRGMLDRRIGWK